MNPNIEFTSWLRRQVYRAGPIGDLGRDSYDDRKWPKSPMVLSTCKAYVESIHACDGAVDALKEAWEEFEILRFGFSRPIGTIAGERDWHSRELHGLRGGRAIHGADVDREGKMLIRSSDVGDDSFLSGVVKRGGPRKVADRLVSKLKKAMESAR